MTGSPTDIERITRLMRQMSDGRMVQQEPQPTDEVIGWRFVRLRADRLLRARRLPQGRGAGAIHHASNRLAVTLPGLHAYPDFRSALDEGTGTVVCRVRLAGTMSQDRYGAFTASEETILWVAPARRLIRAFAIDLAERSLRAERESGREPDQRLWAALAVGRAWVMSEATVKQWLRAKAHAVAAHREAILPAYETVVPAMNRMWELYQDWLAGTARKEDIERAQIAYAEMSGIVARHLAAATVLNIDARLPRRVGKITEDAARAANGTHEANRPAQARLIEDGSKPYGGSWGEESDPNLFKVRWHGVYDELERLVTDTFAPQHPSA